eukprot:TRINITY_DN24247_c0_g1_i1.p1 TRINITY_DN24247_c0_g1~~TRINITY_DN24247_c0_g1_i1.p1  ORF type:complete len:785 (+),score=58.32 TRINITY_DN24247_c0_g1_i1:237-2591(+)
MESHGFPSGPAIIYKWAVISLALLCYRSSQFVTKEWQRISRALALAQARLVNLMSPLCMQHFRNVSSLWKDFCITVSRLLSQHLTPALFRIYRQTCSVFKDLQEALRPFRRRVQIVAAIALLFNILVVIMLRSHMTLSSPGQAAENALQADLNFVFRSAAHGNVTSNGISTKTGITERANTSREGSDVHPAQKLLSTDDYETKNSVSAVTGHINKEQCSLSRSFTEGRRAVSTNLTRTEVEQFSSLPRRKPVEGLIGTKEAQQRSEKKRSGILLNDGSKKKGAKSGGKDWREGGPIKERHLSEPNVGAAQVIEVSSVNSSYQIGQASNHVALGDGERNDEESAVMKLREPRASGLHDLAARFANDENPDTCRGRYIYIYDLPLMFNKDLLTNCRYLSPSANQNLCKAAESSGMGRPAKARRVKDGTELALVPQGRWYETDYLLLEVIFHARICQYRCLTDDAEVASLFYVPFYWGLATLMSAAKNSQKELEEALVQWLGEQPYWGRKHGRDHLMAVASTVLESTSGEAASPKLWSNLMGMSHMRNVSLLSPDSASTKISPSLFTLPPLTSFHPETNEDITAWQTFVRHSRRSFLIAFAGPQASGHGCHFPHGLQTALTGPVPSTCKAFSCKQARCSRPHEVIWHYRSAHFCLISPDGSAGATKTMFDCILAGAIPVVFTQDMVSRCSWSLPSGHASPCIYYSRESFDFNSGTSIVKSLQAMGPSEIEQKRNAVIELIPQIVYAKVGQQPGKVNDAFTLSIEFALQRMQSMGLDSFSSLAAVYLR